ncbi:hypothetical protein [Blastochloris sulfoviridis]|uniref:OadG family protein n=1 Tax=Blastochloris sulfoviridis TaxID=50712 RepID=A0A5M6HN55_9HYPH|nr:hypothetical protein [Blastochloris sulfoviridis]KAA5597255.1 hypothetical protein F1193_14390 [Blastochloris sulfoviridis]
MEAIRLPDTLQGAIILSIIDFFLSFVIIAGIGVVLSLFPLINRIGQKPAQPAAERDPAPTRPVAPDGIPAAHLPVIAAAVHAVVRAGHILRIDGPLPGSSWADQGRARLLAHAAGAASRARPNEPLAPPSGSTDA